MEVQLNYLSILVAVVAAQVLGALWYSKALFGKAWMQAVGKTEEDIKGGMAVQMIGAILLCAVMAFMLAQFIVRMEERSLVAGVMTACWIWGGFIATTMGVNHLFQGSSLKLYLIDSGYHLGSLIVMGAILGAWG